MTTYSYSRLAKFNTCPRQYYHQYIAKDCVYTENEAAKYGSEMHDFLDAAISKDAKFTDRTEHLRPIVLKYKQAPGELRTEFPLSLTDGRKRVEWNADNALIQGRTDLTIFSHDPTRLFIIDWKFAGKPNAEQYRIEMEMFSLLHFWAFPEVDRIDTALEWLKTPAPTSKITFHRKEHLWQIEDKILNNIARVEDAISFENFPCKVSGLCKNYCSAINCEKNGKFREK